MASIRTLISSVIGRSRFANIAGKTFRGKRDLYKVLGYTRELMVQDYRSRFERNAVANRIVKAAPMATWRGGGEVIEDEDPTISTPFEEAFDALNKRLGIWDVLTKADILAGIGRYAVILLGAPGELDTPLESCTPEALVYMKAYGEDDAKIAKWELDTKNERFGQPVVYTIARTAATAPEAMNSSVIGKQVHWTRIIHIADGLLDDVTFGEPRLRAVWNLIDDLEKVSGGGAEAFWKRADGGTQFDLDPTIEFEDEDDPNATADPSVKPGKRSGMKEQIEEYEHGLRRNLLTRGVKVTRMGSDVADFSKPVESIISQISAGTGIPQRVLMGSEQGKLAAKMDRSNWDDRISDRREAYASPICVRPMIDRLLGLGVLPKPSEPYQSKWPQLRVLDDEQRAQIATEWAALNGAMGDVVVTPDEIREHVLDLGKLADAVDPGNLPQLPNAKVLRKFFCLSKEKQKFYAAKVFKVDAAKAKARKRAAHEALQSPLASREAVRIGKHALQRPGLRAAIAAADIAAIDRLLDETLADLDSAS